MRINSELLLLLGADSKPLLSGLAELDSEYSSLTACISAIWGEVHSYESYQEALSEDTPYHSREQELETSERGIRFF